MRSITICKLPSINKSTTMRKSLLFLALLVSLAASTQNNKNTQNKQKNNTHHETTKTNDKLTGLAATFDRIGDAEKDKWLPYYNAALAQTWIGWNPATKDKDANSAKLTAYL